MGQFCILIDVYCVLVNTYEIFLLLPSSTCPAMAVVEAGRVMGVVVFLACLLLLHVMCKSSPSLQHIVAFVQSQITVFIFSLIRC